MIKKKDGFTLIEVMVAMMVTGIILGTVYFLFIKAWNMNMEQNEYINAQDALRISGLQIESDVRRSTQSITINTDGMCYEIIDDTTITYCLQDNTLIRNGSYLTDNVDLLTIEMPSGNAYVDIKLKGSYNGKEISHEKKIYLRTP